MCEGVSRQPQIIWMIFLAVEKRSVNIGSQALHLVLYLIKPGWKALQKNTGEKILSLTDLNIVDNSVLFEKLLSSQCQ